MTNSYISLAAFKQNIKYITTVRKPRFLLAIAWIFIKSLFSKIPPLRGVDIAITYDCNLTCEHCNVEMSHDHERQTLTAQEIVSFIKQATKSGLINITFTGGEALLHYQKLVDILKSIDTGRYLIHLQTNATLLTEEKVAELCGLGLDKIILSFDPYHEEHEWRKMFEIKKQQVHMLQKYNIKTIGVAVAAKDVIYTECFHEMIALTKELDTLLVLNLPVPLGNWLNNKKIVLDKDDQKYVRDLVDKNHHLRLDFDFNLINYGCPAFTERFHVNAYGDVQPCTFSQISFGNIRNDRLTDIRSKGLNTEIFNTFKKYCPPAEDEEFISSYWKFMSDSRKAPLPARDIFHQDGKLKKVPNVFKTKPESVKQAE